MAPQISKSDIFQVTRIVFPPKRIKRKKINNVFKRWKKHVLPRGGGKQGGKRSQLLRLTLAHPKGMWVPNPELNHMPLPWTESHSSSHCGCTPHNWVQALGHRLVQGKGRQSIDDPSHGSPQGRGAGLGDMRKGPLQSWRNPTEHIHLMEIQPPVHFLIVMLANIHQKEKDQWLGNQLRSIERRPVHWNCLGK